MAYLRSTKSNSNINTIHLPIVCVKRKDIHLRRDVELLLQSVKLELSDLICIDDITVASSLSSVSTDSDNKIKFILLDHNVASNKVMSLNGNNNIDNLVEEIIDHHVDVGYYPQCSGSYRNIAWNKDTNTAAVGSACTLVGELYISEAEDLLDSDISTLLMGVISLDTYNMDPKVGKGTSRDKIIYDELQNRCIKDVDRNKLFDKLINAKTDITFWRGLHPSDQLALDYKNFDSVSTVFGMSSILLPVTEFLNHNDVISVIDKYLEKNDDQVLDILAVMSFVTNPEPTRELLLLSYSESRLNDILTYIETKHSTIELSPIDIDSSIIDKMKQKKVYGLAFKQGNLKMSRKQVAPILQQYYEQL
jgi:inorganic pyrophosphatase/exopolyphosphatase